MLGEPLPQLLHESRGIVEQAIDQIDDLAVEPGGTRRKTLAGDFRRIAARIVNAQELSHAFLNLLSDNRKRPCQPRSRPLAVQDRGRCPSGAWQKSTRFGRQSGRWFSGGTDAFQRN